MRQNTLKKNLRKNLEPWGKNLKESNRITKVNHRKLPKLNRSNSWKKNSRKQRITITKESEKLKININTAWVRQKLRLLTLPNLTEVQLHKMPKKFKISNWRMRYWRKTTNCLDRKLLILNTVETCREGLRLHLGRRVREKVSRHQIWIVCFMARVKAHLISKAVLRNLQLIEPNHKSIEIKAPTWIHLIFRIHQQNRSQPY